MKPFFIYLLVLLITNSRLFAQDSAFVRTIGGVNMDVARDVKECDNLGFVIAGTTSSFGQGNTSMYLVKTDSMGRHIWSKNYGGLNSDWAYSVETTLDNGFLLSGFSNSFSSDYDPFVVKTDNDGNLLWQKVYPLNDWDFIYGSVALPDSSFILCGETYSNAIGGADGLLMRIDKLGNLMWMKNIGTTGDDKLKQVIFLNNTIYSVGSSTSNLHKNGMLVKLDVNGNNEQKFYFTYDTNSDQELNCLDNNSSNELVMAGYVNPDGVNDINDWLIKVDTLGNVLFNYSGPAGANGTKEFNDIVIIDNDEIVTAGTNNGGNGALGLFMVRYNSAGLYIAADNFGGLNNEYGYGVTLTSNKHIAFVGGTESYTCGDQDMYFVMNRNQHFVANSKLNNKFFCDTLGLAVVGLKDLNKINAGVNCFPNPFSDKLHVEINQDIDKDEILVFSLKDVSGRLIIETKVQTGDNEVVLNELSAGMYFFEISSTSKILTTGKLIHQK